MGPAKILIADDNSDIRKFLVFSLEQEGYEVLEAKDGAEALSQFAANDINLAILDISMGKPDGIEVCREIRERSSVPIIILTERGSELDEVMCLAIGADDFITKPCTSQVLLLRVGIQLRHQKEREDKIHGTLELLGMKLDLSLRELKVNNTCVPITRTEFEFLQLLMSDPKRIFSREEIYAAIGGSSEFSSDKLLDTHASRIRIKIRAAGGPNTILAVRGIGYRIVS